ncbi:hypothetical protein GALL_383050 [mine drainage metagenome]|uniref:Uncharacterized protein n=1 Tax=mine drainage metagenome TaxID=410659 RepID=A0A1J5Q9U3_9ZZZZ
MQLWVEFATSSMLVGRSHDGFHRLAILIPVTATKGSFLQIENRGGNCDIMGILNITTCIISGKSPGNADTFRCRECQVPADLMLISGIGCHDFPGERMESPEHQPKLARLHITVQVQFRGQGSLPSTRRLATIFVIVLLIKVLVVLLNAGTGSA